MEIKCKAGCPCVSDADKHPAGITSTLTTTRNAEVVLCHGGRYHLPKRSPNKNSTICHSALHWRTYSLVFQDVLKSKNQKLGWMETHTQAFYSTAQHNRSLGFIFTSCVNFVWAHKLWKNKCQRTHMIEWDLIIIIIWFRQFSFRVSSSVFLRQKLVFSGDTHIQKTHDGQRHQRNPLWG